MMVDSASDSAEDPKPVAMETMSTKTADACIPEVTAACSLAQFGYMNDAICFSIPCRIAEAVPIKVAKIRSSAILLAHGVNATVAMVTKKPTIPRNENDRRL